MKEYIFEKDVTILSEFERRAFLCPNNTALIIGEKRTTFEELNSMANRMARLLHLKGIRKGMPVAICFERSQEAIVSILALMKLGSPYVPISPVFPVDRRKLIIEDVGARMVLVQSHLSSLFSDPALEVLSVDSSIEQTTSYVNENLKTEISSSDVMWILYTSGSTGVPKGVQGTHIGSLNRIQWIWKTQQFEEGEVCFQNTGFNTVDSFWEIFAPLCQGNPLVILSDEIVRDANRIIPELAKYPIRRICLVPSYLSAILSIYPDLRNIVPHLNIWVVSGEPLTLDVCRRFYKALPNAALFNQYGLTETCADITSFDTRNLNLMKTEPGVPIGTPIDGVRLFLLDGEMRQVPPGIEGELYIGGICISKGYLNRPDAMKERYIELSPSDLLSKRLNYHGLLLKTGDLAKVHSDGNLCHEGRNDTQVKINGFRVELEEIESVLLQHDYVKDAAVIMWQKGTAPKHLIAFVVLKKDVSETELRTIESKLQSFLATQLPSYMVPSKLRLLKELRRTATGKIDRKALSELEASQVEVCLGAHVAPRTDVEKWLLKKWSVLLATQSLGIESNFFHEGGHSLIAVQMLAMVRKEFGVDLPLRAIFEGPTIEALSLKIESLRNNKTNEIYHSSFSIPDVSDREYAPLSIVQQRLWFLSRLNPNSPVYHLPTAYELGGEVDKEKLARAISLLSERHQIIRSSFRQVKDEIVQIKNVFPSIQLEVVQSSELEHATDEVLKEKISRVLEEEAQRPFDLLNEPAFRAKLFTIHNRLHYLMISVHHIISDGWSLSVFMKELGVLYNSFNSLAEANLPELPLTYCDFSAWHNDFLSGTSLDTQYEFWKEKLRSASGLLALPTDFARPKVMTNRGRCFEGVLKKHVVDKLHSLGNQHGASPFMTLLGVFKVLLFRYSGQEDIIVGTPIANRHYPGVDGIFGFFANTVVIRTHCQGLQSFLGLLEEIKRETLAVAENQDIPFDKVVEITKAERDLSYNPIFQVMFDYQHSDEFRLVLEGVSARQVLVDTHTSRFDLSMALVEDSLGLRVKIEYSTDLFRDSSIERFFEHFCILAEQILENPSRAILDYEIVTPGERALFEVWNDTRVTFSEDKNIISYFEEQVHKTPNAIALVFQDKSLTYSQLNERSNQLAHYLRGKGVSSNVLVAVCLERSLELVVSLLAVLKAGGAYVPVDPEYPLERIEYMTQESGAKVLLSTNNVIRKVGDFEETKVLLDIDSKIISQEDSLNLSRNGRLDDLAYVIFTSGSTGKPKGVEVTHCGLLNIIMDMKGRIGFSTADTLLSVTTISFDIAGLELFTPLISGARLVLADRETAIDGRALARLFSSTNTTIMQATPATLRILLEAEWHPLKDSKLLCGGEALPIDLARSLTMQGQLWNVYGPTETTIWSTAEKVDINVDAITIGRPISNTQIYILNDHLKRVPVGVPGNLYIGGKGLARGYFNRPDLTEERFITFNTDIEEEVRLYKTGDVARFLADGRIEYLGRSDNQIKLRGFRIELGEIETSLEQHEAVKQAVVVPVKGSDGDVKLVAHVVPSSSLSAKPIDFSLFYFSAGASAPSGDLYQLYISSAQMADEMRFKAIWTPERHFHEVGGQFPSPSILSAALAMVTKNVELRAGSVVLPLHHPLRVAEEWAVVDNLSNGRVGLAFASGWNPKDFAFMPENFARRRDLLKEGIHLFRKLWSGDKIPVMDGLGNPGAVAVFPRPQQKDIPIWFTASGDPSTFIEAGRMGSNLLTHLLGQTKEALREKIALYHQALLENGFDPGKKTVTLMLHAFVLDNEHEAVERSRKPFCDYLKAHISLENMSKSVGKDMPSQSDEEIQTIIDLAFERYSKTASLIGSVESCIPVIEELKEIGVNEIACLIDFGIDYSSVLEGLKYLGALLQRTKTLDTFNKSILFSHLRNSLPEYMVPSGIVVRDEFPLTSNGKVDRKKLVEEGVSWNEPSKEIVPPSSDTERALAAIWSILLGSSVGSVTDSFFALGGHSLLATQMASRIRKTFGVDLPLRVFFEAPTIQGLAQRIDTAVNATKVRTNTFSEVTANKTSGDIERVPLSFAQERLWFISQVLPGSVLYSVPIIFHLTGKLDKQLFIDALVQVLHRHEVFRTKIEETEGTPIQVIQAHSDVAFEEIDCTKWANLSSTDLLEKITKMLLADAAIPFDLKRAPLYRAKLLRVNWSEHFLYLNFHHIIWDGWSRVVFTRELGEIYNALLESRKSDELSSPTQYREYAGWQRELLKDASFEKQLEFWRQRLGDLPSLLHLPTDFPRPKELSYQGKIQSVRISKNLQNKLRLIGQKQDASLFMVLFTAFKVFLFRLTGQEDIAIGTPVANRHYSKFESTIGLFVNTVCIRSQCNSNLTFNEYLQAEKREILDATENQDVPFERVVEAVQAPRDLGFHPLFQIMFDMQAANEWLLPLRGVGAEFIPLDIGVSRFDLSLSAKEDDAGIEFCFEYSTDLFHNESIRALAVSFEAILACIAETPTIKIGSIPLVSQELSEQLPIQLSLSGPLSKDERNVVQVFEDCVRRKPESPALIMDSRVLKYRELNEFANQISHRLLALGIHEGSPVAVLLKPSFEAIAGMLAVLKAGAFYVPIDVDYPSERVRFILEDAKISVLISESQLRSKCEDFGGQRIDLDLDRQVISNESKEAPELKVTNTGLAYAIYTSGSTGIPKGVCIEHRSIIRLVIDNGYLDIGPRDRVALASSLAFDAATFEVWGPLLNGGVLVILSKEVFLEPARLFAAIEQFEIDVMWLTSSYFNQIVSFNVGTFRRLRALLIGGEALNVEKVRLLIESGHCPARLINGYGPTENTTFSTTFDITGNYNKIIRNIPIGVPIAGTSVYVMDESMRPCPAGFVGEIFLSGTGLARCYLNRPELTRERFVVSSVQGNAATRLYRTGDIGRISMDGNVEFIGRVDGQVKLRGFRIELGEIESLLVTFHSMSEAAVVITDDGNGEKMLVAYVRPRIELNADAQNAYFNELRSYLKQRLPDYMVPSYFVKVAQLPLNASGKLDRARLPKPERKVQSTNIFVAPRTVHELEIVKAFEYILQKTHVSVTDNFFSIGGHSLLAVRLSGILSKRLNINISVSTLFSNPTPEALAKRISIETSREKNDPILEIQANGGKTPLFLVHPAMGLAVPFFALQGLIPDEGIYGLSDPFFGKPQSEFESVEDMASMYLEAIRKIQSQGPYRLGGWSFGGVVAFEMAKQLRAAGEEVDIVVLIDSFVSSNPSQGSIGREDLDEFLSSEGVDLKSDLAAQCIMELQRNTELLMKYRPGLYKGRVVLIKAAQGNGSDNPLAFSHLNNDWSKYVKGSVEEANVPGIHTELFRPDQVKYIAAILIGILGKLSSSK